MMSKLEKPMVVGDVLVAILMLVGGMTRAIQLECIDCGLDWRTMGDHKLINGGCIKDEESVHRGFSALAILSKRCRIAEANTTFQLLEFFAAVAALVLYFAAFSQARKSYGSGSGV